MPSLSFKSENIPIAVTGLPQAGKTAFIRRAFQKREIDGIKRTLGIDVEIVERDNMKFQFFDLGGQEELRNMIWQQYVTKAEAIIYVFDSTNPIIIDDAREWFWRVSTDWCRKDAIILFLANKWDIKEKLTIDFIKDRLGLNLFSKDSLKSFKIFQTSMKTGDNIEEALNWLIKKLKVNKIINKVHIYSLNLSFFDKNNRGITIDFEIDDKMKKVFNALNKSVFLDVNGETTNYVQFNDYQVIHVKVGQFSCSLMVNKGDSKNKTKIIAGAILRKYRMLINEEPELSNETVIENIIEFINQNIG